MKVDNINAINTTALAYMGDAVYEQAVREHIMKKGSYHVHNMHMNAINFVKAAAQAKIIKTMFHDLPENEQKLVKRARNKKFATKAKNADPVTYKWATAFEALVGYLYLADETERLQTVLSRAIEIAEKGEK
jgi:ribonuclease III family protein